MGSKDNKILKFTGQKSDWKMWSEVYKARAEVNDFLQVMLDKPENIPKKDYDKTDKGLNELNKKNLKAYSNLLSCISMKTSAGRIAINLVMSSKSEYWPNGNIAQAWLNLKRKYEPRTIAEVTRVKKSYVNATMKKGQDPDSFIDYLERLQIQMRELEMPVSDNEFIVDLTSKLSNEYENVIDKINDCIDSGEDIDIETIRDRLRSKYDRMNIKKPYQGRKQFQKEDEDSNSDDDKEDEEKAFYASDQFKGRCYKCGKQGHKGSDCRTGLICFNCGKKGH